MTDGSVFKRKLKGGRFTWCWQLQRGRGPDGKRQRLFKSGYKLQREAEAALADVRREKDKGPIKEPSTETLSAWAEQWFADIGPRTRSPKTLERYRQLADYFLPKLGCVPLAELGALEIETELFRLLKQGGHFRKRAKDGSIVSRALSPKTIRHLASTLNVILTAAVKKKIIPHQPMDAVELPKIERHEGKALEASEIDAYLTEARRHGLYELLAFAAASGARRGECCALQWADIDLQAGTAKIVRSLEQTKAQGLRIKSTKSNRVRIISLPPSIVELLRFHRESQQESRRLFGDDYRTDLDLVFPLPDGDYRKPDTVSSKASLIARKAGLSATSLHSLRHSHGSHLLSAGLGLPEVSRRLGHADVSITARIYSHALREDDSKAAQLWDEHFGRKISGGTLRAASGCTDTEKPN